MGLSLYVGLPTYGWQRFNTIPLISMVQEQRRFAKVEFMEQNSSFLTNSFNQILLDVIERHKEGSADFFLMMHADIIPMHSKTWLDELMDAHNEVKSQVLSVVVPIKDQRGITSTALETEDLWAPRRLTLKEIFERDETFTDPQLLINTGMLLIDMRRNDWIEKVCFTIHNSIRETNGRRVACSEPEDWNFSRQAKGFGATLWATRKVPVFHIGDFPYPNFSVWGNETDPGDALDSYR